MSTYTGKFKPEKQQLNMISVSVARRKVCRCQTKVQIYDFEHNTWKCKKCGTYQ